MSLINVSFMLVPVLNAPEVGGSVGGSVDTGGNVVIRSVGGSVDTGGNVVIRSVGGSVDTGGNVVIRSVGVTITASWEISTVVVEPMGLVREVDSTVTSHL